MPTTTIAALGESLKEIYAPRLTKLTRLKSQFLTIVPETADGIDLDLLEARFPVRVRMGSNVGARWELESYPDGEDPVTIQGRARVTKQTIRYAFSHETLLRSQKTEGAWEDHVERMEDDTALQAARDIARQVFGAGQGVVAVCGTTSNDNDVVLDSGTVAAQWRFLRRGLRVDIGTVANPTAVAENRRITDVDPSSGTITIDGAAVTTDGTHRVFVTGAGGATSWGDRELVSLQQIAGTGDIYNINVSQYPEYVGYQARGNGGTNRVLTETLVDQFVSDIRQNDGVEPTHLVTTPGAFRAAAAQIIGQVQYTMDDQNDLEHGIRTLELGGSRVKVFQDDFVWEGTGFLVNIGVNGLQMAASGDYEPVDDPVIRTNEDNDGAQSRFRRYLQLIVTNRPSIGFINALTES